LAEESWAICGNIAKDMTTVVLSSQVLLPYAYHLWEVIKLG